MIRFELELCEFYEWSLKYASQKIAITMVTKQRHVITSYLLQHRSEWKNPMRIVQMIFGD